MWTFVVAVAFGGRGVDANLRILQLYTPVSLKLPTGTGDWLEDRGTCGGDESHEETPVRGVIPVGARGGFGMDWKNSEDLSEQWLKSLASTSTVDKFISQDIDGQIHCRLLPKFLEWLIEEIGVVEEIIRRKVPSV
ncbi:hypothetical protein Taro_039209 [Colocasia esculenta]|uniref:Uncharacterized protein n=1 Tax=Colocasia esculenta TaxID=4460 RepID=A0A843WA33_COLES|nr:hypothetical protein [Colocasia esculenta]